MLFKKELMNYRDTDMYIDFKSNRTFQNCFKIVPV